MQLTPQHDLPADDPHLPHAGGSLPSAVLVAAAAVLIALVGVLWAGLLEERKQLVESAYAAADRSALRLATRAAEVIDRADEATRVIKSAREHGNVATLDLSRGRLHSDEVASAFLVTDARGVVTSSTLPEVMLDFGEDEHFKRLASLADSGVAIGRARQDRVSGGWVIPLMRRIDDANGFAGVVVALLTPQALVHGVGDEKADGISRSIVGIDGSIRAHTLKSTLVAQGTVPNAATMVARLGAARAASRLETDPLDGRTVVAVATPVAGRELFAWVASPATELEAASVKARNRALAWGSVAGLLLMGGAVGLWQQAGQLEASRRAARHASALYVATLEGSMDALWLMDPLYGTDGEVIDFIVRDANRRSLELVKLVREQVIGKHFSDLLPHSKDDGLLKMLRRVHRTRQTFDVETTSTEDVLAGRWLHLQAVSAGDSVALIARDVTERREAAQRLAERESLMRTLLDALPLAVYAKSARPADHGQVRFWNKAAERQYGLSAEQAIGRTTDAYLPGAALQAILQDTAVGRERRAMVFPEVAYDGESGPRYLDFRKVPVFDVDDELDMILVIAEDVTTKRADAEQLRLVSRVVQETGDAVLLTDRTGRVVLANAAFASITGRAADALIGTTALELGLPVLRDSDGLTGVEQALRESRHWAGESPLPRLQGAPVETWLRVSAITDGTGATTHHAWLFSDISVLKTQERQLAELARRDALTGLANRRHFEEALDAAAARTRRHGQALALVYLDLDGFKKVNDTLGHEVGDRLLIEVARRLRNAVRSTDLVSRLGGDEFTVILEYAGSIADRAMQCQRLLAELSRPYELAGQQVVSTPSIGIAVFRSDESTEGLRERADAAMYAAKRAGKAQVHVASDVVLLDAGLRGPGASH